MKKVMTAAALSCLLAVPAMANAAPSEGFSINPMIGAAYNKTFKTHLAVGAEVGYDNVLLGYIYDGDKDNMAGIAGEGEELVGFKGKVKYKAHQIYGGYKFDVGAGQLALKAGIEASKIKGKVANIGEPGVGTAKSNTTYNPVIGVGYYFDNGINVNANYTIHTGKRKWTASSTTGSEKFKAKDKDLNTFMFTVGYNF